MPGLGRSHGEVIGYPLQYSWSYLVPQMVKNPPAMQETWVWSLGWEDPLKEGMATHSSIPAWRIPMDSRAWGAIVHGVKGSYTTEQLSTEQHSTRKLSMIGCHPGLELMKGRLCPWVIKLTCVWTSPSLSIRNNRQAPCKFSHIFPTVIKQVLVFGYMEWAIWYQFLELYLDLNV